MHGEEEKGLGNDDEDTDVDAAIQQTHSKFFKMSLNSPPPQRFT